MKLRSIIFATLFALHSVRADPGTDEFYVWQQQWSPAVVSAVLNEAPTTLYPLLTVVPAQGKSRLTKIPWKQLAETQHRIVPVIRVPVKAFQRADISEELSRITAQLIQSVSGCHLDEIQLDIDCPERRLTDYKKLIDSYRSRWPSLRLSITALPCHLNNPSFIQVAEAADLFVLQVHGLDAPDHISMPATLLDLKIARRAIQQAETLQHPYLIALPCYAYELNFSPESGRFLFLTAEQPAVRKETLRKRIAAGPADLLNLQNQIHSLRFNKGIIWFRLPVEGDRLCLTRPDLAMLQNGELPTSKLTVNIETLSPTTLEIEVKNEGIIHATQAILDLNWPTAAGSYDLYRDMTPAPSNPGDLPQQITLPVPAPGQTVRVGWFQSAQPPATTIKLQ